MTKLELAAYNLFCQAKLLGNKFIYDEDGEVNVVAIVVLCGVAVALALFFKDQIKDILDNLFKNIGNTANQSTDPI